MEWYLVAFVALFLLAAIGFWLVGRQRVHAERVGLDRLENRLHELGVDPGDDPTPPVELLRLHIQHSDTILAATRARRESKKALLVILEDRLVYVAATVGRVGSEARTIRYDRIEGIESETDVGGTLRLQTSRGPFTFTHIPLGKFDEIITALHRRVRGEPPARRPLRPATNNEL